MSAEAKSLGHDLRRTIALALPVMLARMGLVLLLTTDTVLVGRAGGRDLAFFAISTAPQLIMQTIGVGLLLGTVVLTAQADGAKRFEECGRIWRLALILAGTLGNMYDRVFTDLHRVRDFIKFYYRPASGPDKVWPLFNLADAFICVGVFLLTIEMMFFDERNRKPDEPPNPAPRAPAGPVPGPGPVVEGK